MNSKITISKLDNQLDALAFHSSRAKRNLLVNTSYTADNSKYVYPESQIPIIITVAKRIPPQSEHSFQIQNLM